MKRFSWPLQRYLDVTIQREQGARAVLFALSREIAALRGQIIRRQSMLRTLLEDLSAQEFSERLARQELVMRCSAALEREMTRLRQKLTGLEKQRQEQTAAFMRLRNSRQTLEKVRVEALQRHARQQDVLEQKQLDENAHVSFARRMIHTTLAGQ